jgi:hypothetical protein
MTRRYLFLCPDRTSASGGVAVIYDTVALLNRAGRTAAVVHNSPEAGYPDHPETVPAVFTRKMRQAEWPWIGRRGKLEWTVEALARLGRTRRLAPLSLQPGDVIVTPEYMLAEALAAFEGWPIVVYVQNPFGLMMAHDRAIERGFDPSGEVVFWLGMSEVCRSHMDILGARNTAFFPVSMKPQDFPFRDAKSDLITFMPRKRPWEARVIARALQARGRLGRYRLEALDGMSRATVAERIAESRIFISLLKEESLGFPAAEAMAAGCIVVGFDGLGGAEFFDETTGLPVAEGDVAGVVTAVEAVIEEYARDPTRLDAMRRHASERVNARYNTAAFEAGVLEAWQQLETTLEASRGS